MLQGLQSFIYFGNKDADLRVRTRKSASCRGTLAATIRNFGHICTLMLLLRFAPPVHKFARVSAASSSHCVALAVFLHTFPLCALSNPSTVAGTMRLATRRDSLLNRTERLGLRGATSVELSCVAEKWLRRGEYSIFCPADVLHTGTAAATTTAAPPKAMGGSAPPPPPPPCKRPHTSTHQTKAQVQPQVVPQNKNSGSTGQEIYLYILSQ